MSRNKNTPWNKCYKFLFKLSFKTTNMILNSFNGFPFFLNKDKNSLEGLIWCVPSPSPPHTLPSLGEHREQAAWGAQPHWPASGPLGFLLTVHKGALHMLFCLQGSSPPFLALFLVSFYSPFWSLFTFPCDGIFCDMHSQNQVFFLHPIVSLMGLCDPCLRLPLDYQFLCITQNWQCLELQTLNKCLVSKWVMDNFAIKCN